MRKTLLISLSAVFLFACTSSTRSTDLATPSLESVQSKPETPIFESSDFVIVGRLERISSPQAACGILHIGAIAEYTNLKILNGKYSEDKIYVVHGCPELARNEYADNSGSLISFHEGDYHILHLTSQNIFRIEIVNSGDIQLPIDPSNVCQNRCNPETLVQSQDGMMYFSSQVDLYSEAGRIHP